MAVTMIFPPLNIYWIERGIKLIAKNKMVDVIKSQKAGIANRKTLILSDKPASRDSYRDFS